MPASNAQLRAVASKEVPAKSVETRPANAAHHVHCTGAHVVQTIAQQGCDSCVADSCEPNGQLHLAAERARVVLTGYYIAQGPGLHAVWLMPSKAGNTPRYTHVHEAIRCCNKQGA